MDSRPLISCVIPTRDRPDLLRRAIDSVLNQTYANVEVVAVASPPHESTRQIFQEYEREHHRLKPVYIQDTSGPIYARNIGIEEASGEYIAFLDDDDVWLSKKLEHQIPYLSDHSIISCLVRIRENTGVRDPNSELPDWIINEFGVKEAFCDFLTLYPSCVIMKKSELIGVGCFDEKFRNFGIWDLSLRILDKYDSAYVIDRDLVIYQNTDDYYRLSHDPRQLAVEMYETYQLHRDKVPPVYGYKVGKQLGFKAFRKEDGIIRFKYFLSALFSYFNLMIRGFPNVDPGD